MSCSTPSDHSSDSIQGLFKLEIDEDTQLVPSDQNQVFDGYTLQFLIEREEEYKPDAFYFQRTQKDITPIMRTILIDWMLEVMTEFTLKRETFYYALNYVDRYLSLKKNIKKQDLQLVGVTSMFMASKMEEILSPKVQDFVKSTDDGYSQEQIVAMEKEMMREMKWLMAPPTPFMWASWYMNQWDIFIEG